MAALILSFAIPSFAVVDQRLEIQGANLVLSWPSSGNEYYLIQHRTTLDTNTPWTTLTNNYPANSTNRTTFIIPCCLLPPFGAATVESMATAEPGVRSNCGPCKILESRCRLSFFRRGSTPTI
ncbi:MAG: hypothetical protein M3Y82_14320 [Verrucomicrobiota bacterium]|nr:hypothetical protein [Verrucomicrobiota bacterium]